MGATRGAKCPRWTRGTPPETAPLELLLEQLRLRTQKLLPQSFCLVGGSRVGLRILGVKFCGELRFELRREAAVVGALTRVLTILFWNSLEAPLSDLSPQRLLNVQKRR